MKQGIHPAAERSRRARELLLPGAVGLIGLLVSVSVWATLVLERHERVRSETQTVATSIRNAIQGELASQDRALLSLAAFWPADLDVKAAAAMRADADRLLHAHPGLDRIAVFDSDSGESLFVSLPVAHAQPAPGTGPESVPPLASSEMASTDTTASERTATEPPSDPLPADEARWLEIDALALHAAEDAYHLHLPIGVGEETDAHLVAHFDPTRFLVDFFRARSESYAIEVQKDGVPIYARGEPSSDSWHSWWKVVSTLPLPDGSRWQFLYRPTPEYASARLTAVPHYVLFLGLSLSTCLAFLSHELRRTRRRSRSLGVANASLQQRGRELLRLNEELEHRVGERTRELEDAIVELRAFNDSVSHDLRSPLGAVLNFASILKDD